MERQLQTGAFEAFWGTVGSPAGASAVAGAKGFAEAARAYIGRVVAATYGSIELDVLARLLNLGDAASAASAATGMGWRVEGGSAAPPASDANTSRPKVVETPIVYGDVAKLLQ